MHAQRHQDEDGRWHFRHGPIDIVWQAEGDTKACARALQRAWQRFPHILPELVRELPFLRQPVSALQGHRFAHPVAARMHRVCQQAASAAADGFVTPMAAVAGAVAQDLLAHLVVPGIDKAMVNNGGDIAMHLAEGQQWRIGWVSDVARVFTQPHGLSHGLGDALIDGRIVIDHTLPVRGVATSGWRGRSFSLGMADSVTVLAADAAQADVAATLIANAVNVSHPAIVRRPAADLRDDTDLGHRLVTVEVPTLPAQAVRHALDLGLDCARQMQAQGWIHAALLCCQGQVAMAEALECGMQE